MTLRFTPHVGVNPYFCLIFCEVSADAIVVVGIRHAMRDPGSMPGSGGT